MQYLRLTQDGAAADWELAADGARYPTTGGFVLDNEELGPYRVTVEVDVVGGKPILRKLVAERQPNGLPITRRGLNSIPVAQMLEEIVRRHGVRFPAETGERAIRTGTQEERDAAVRALRPARGRRGDPKAREELVRRVAELYQELTNNKISHPKPVIAQQLGYSTSYIGTLVAEARRMTPPLIGKPAGPGRAGNVSTKMRSKRGTN